LPSTVTVFCFLRIVAVGLKVTRRRRSGKSRLLPAETAGESGIVPRQVCSSPAKPGPAGNGRPRSREAVPQTDPG
jgi:hypothetical protein